MHGNVCRAIAAHACHGLLPARGHADRLTGRQEAFPWLEATLRCGGAAMLWHAGRRCEQAAARG
eukprot:356952-Chlamydomonas_euryale.AAC.3